MGPVLAFCAIWLQRLRQLLVLAGCGAVGMILWFARSLLRFASQTQGVSCAVSNCFACTPSMCLYCLAAALPHCAGLTSSTCGSASPC